MAIYIYNTLTRKKEVLKPRQDGKVAMYVCGPTVYNFIHLGNARTFLNFDVIRRYLIYSGYEVTFVQNITDIDDKIINRAKDEGLSPSEIAAKYTAAFEEDMKALGVLPPDIAPKATEHVDDMISVVSALVDKGYAYVSGGDVYFEVSKFPDYGKLSRRELEEQQVTVQFDEELEKKRSPLDFALWKAAKPGEPYWSSPWGPGRPGWHIECSTMSMKYLGEDFDIHGGGLDLVFPHHENEIAQAEAYSGRRFVRYWMHSGMLNIDQEKMSKSLGNIKLLREVLRQHNADTVRLLMLQTHYRSPLSFSDESLDESAAALDRLRTCVFNLRDAVARIGDVEDSDLSSYEEEVLRRVEGIKREFKEAMDDDFNTALAVGAIFGLVREANSFLSHALKFKSPGSKKVMEFCLSAIEELTGALGLKAFEAVQVSAGEGSIEVSALKNTEEIETPRVESLVELLLEVRQSAREKGEYEIADMIRGRLSEMGVRVEDLPSGYRWRLEKI